MIVLDTHAWIWWAAKLPDLSPRARRAIEEEPARGVAAISCWEVAMLVRKGRLTLDRDVGAWVETALRLPGVELLDLSPSIAVGAALLDEPFHGDPADRMIAATALQVGAPVITKDRKLRDYKPLRTVW